MFTDRRGEGAPLLLLHGIGSAHGVWDGMAPALARRHELMAVDLPGFGDSPELPPGRRNLPAYADAIEAEMDRAGWERAHLMGHSMGGWLALELAGRGRAVMTFALSPVGGAVLDEVDGSRAAIKADHRRAMVAARLPDAVVKAILTPDRLRKWALRNQVRDGDLVDPASIVHKANVMGESPAFHYMLDEIRGRQDLVERNAERFGRITTPVMIAWGSDDRVLPAAGVARLAAVIPSCELHDLPGQGHSPLIDHPDMVARIALEFFARGA